MSTRGLCGFRKNGQDKLAYNHYDSYPKELGKNVVELCRRTPVEQFSRAFDAIELIPVGSEATPEQIAQVGLKWSNYDLPIDSPADWRCLLEKAEGKLESYTEGGLTFMIDHSSFIKFSLFCEWAYIINLDTSKLEVWKGFCKTPSESNRYGSKKEDGYYPCKMIKEWDLDSIPQDWLLSVSNEE